MSSYATLHELADGIPCDYCKARPGKPCVTVTGRRASYKHSARTRAIFEANGLGYCEGMADGFATVANRLHETGGYIPSVLQEFIDASEKWRP